MPDLRSRAHRDRANQDEDGNYVVTGLDGDGTMWPGGCLWTDGYPWTDGLSEPAVVNNWVEQE